MGGNLLYKQRTIIIMVCIGIALLSFESISKAGTIIDNSSKLLDLATKKFGTLTPVEEKLFKAIAEGFHANYHADDLNDNDPCMAKNWSKERILKSDRITWLWKNNEA